MSLSPSSVGEPNKAEVLSKLFQDIASISDLMISQNSFLMQRLMEHTKQDGSCAEGDCSDSSSRTNLHTEIASLKEVVSKLKAQKLCLRCNCYERCMVAVPCMHIVTCKDCVKYSTHCFVCGKRQESFFEVSYR